MSVSVFLAHGAWADGSGRMQAHVCSHDVDHAPLGTTPAVVLDIIREVIAD